MMVKWSTNFRGLFTYVYIFINNLNTSTDYMVNEQYILCYKRISNLKPKNLFQM